ncbi:PREDICTED: tenascin-R-like, partial [Thamnophis sirtalis]|uniref:Tenascin-R-like n=1 Tax=Thamnophis sirtalis TaxID=35019 RepID=A0A6I9YW38_9SAUR
MAVTEYVISYQPAVPGGLQLQQRVPGDWSTVTLKELEPGLTYNISIYAVISEVLSAPVGVKVATQLSTPRGLQFKTITETTVEMEWEPFSFSFDGWEISFIPKDNEGGVIAQLPSSMTTFNQTGLKPGEEYTVNVVALKEQARSSPTSASVSTLFYFRLFYITELDSPHDLIVTASTETSISVSWTKVKGPIDHYRVIFMQASGMASEVTVSKDKSALTLTDLEPGTEYTISVIAERGRQQSLESTVDAFTGFRPITQLHFSHVTSSSVNITWNDPSPPADRLILTYSPKDKKDTKEVMLDPTKRHAALSGLQPSTEYIMSLVAVHGLVSSEPIVGSVTTGIDPPKNLTIVNVTTESVALRWAPPMAPFDHYKISCKSAQGRVDNIVVAKGITEYTLNYLQPSTEYEITLKSIRGREESESLSHTMYTAMDHPKNLIAINITPTETLLKWDPPGVEAENYVIVLTHDSVAGETILVDRTQQEYKLIDLLPSTSYKVTMYAINGPVTSRTIFTNFTT